MFVVLLRLMADSVSADALHLLRLILDTPDMRELSVAEQRYQAVLAVISDGSSISQVVSKAEDVVGGFPLADGSGGKALTGIDDHSRTCDSTAHYMRRTPLACQVDS
jgi:hypothetical protein